MSRLRRPFLYDRYIFITRVAHTLPSMYAPFAATVPR